MNPAHLSDLKKYLNSLGLRAKKSLSQNFLIDENIVHKILNEAEVEKDQVIVEIGPGPGALTKSLLEKEVDVIAIEKDNGFAKHFPIHSPRLELFHADFMDFDLESFLKQRLKKGQKAKVVANLPYHLSTAIIERLIPRHELFSSLHLMLQKEYALRLCAEAKSKDYGSLSVFSAFHTKRKIAFEISENCFYPKPKIRSALVSLQLHNQYPSTPNFFKIIRLAFSQRRKMLRSSLKTLFPSSKIEQALEKCSLNKQSRPEELALSDFLKLQKALEQ